MQYLLDQIQLNRQDQQRGIYSICSAHPLVLEAALLQGKQDNTPVLIESTANQVNQFGGYTQMQAADFIEFVYQIAEQVGIEQKQIIFGGDHLGPTCWTTENAADAMQKSIDLIRSYVAAGYKKIHLDTSMQCADDHAPLADTQVALRAATLCEVAEQTAIEQFGSSDLLYIIGTEVPPPGGATEAIKNLEITPPERAEETLSTHKKAFAEKGLQAAWQRVIGLVVQPGVEFDNFSVIHYDPAKAIALSSYITQWPNMVYEAHSTDYQRPECYDALVRDHFAILKVGPQLTYALREALFALSHIEDHLLPASQRSNLREVCEQVMRTERQYWQRFYGEHCGILTRRFSYSDRIRYYWKHPEVGNAVNQLLDNLTHASLPMPLLQQYLPRQHQAVQQQTLACSARAWIIDHIRQVIQVYASACNPSGKE